MKFRRALPFPIGSSSAKFIRRHPLLALIIAAALIFAQQNGYLPAVSAWSSSDPIAVIDGDTLKIRQEAGLLKVRLRGIDAPELNQPYGIEAGAQLDNLVKNGHIRIEEHGQDNYGRTLAVLYRDDGRNINLALVQSGAAWVDRRYNSDPAYHAAEGKARSGQLGLWRKPSPTPPWDWRRGRQ